MYNGNGMLPNPLTSTRHRPFFLAEASVAATKQAPPAEVFLAVAGCYKKASLVF